MKKRVLVAVLLLAVICSVSAAGFNPFGYASPMKEGKKVLDLGLAIGGGFGVHANYEQFKTIKAGSLNLPLSFGGTFDGTFGSGFMAVTAAGRACWHIDLGLGMPLDVYAGTQLGIYMWYIKDIAIDIGCDAGGFSGVRYWFSNTMAGFAEFGYTHLTYVKAGVTLLM